MVSHLGRCHLGSLRTDPASPLESSPADAARVAKRSRAPCRRGRARPLATSAARSARDVALPRGEPGTDPRAARPGTTPSAGRCSRACHPPTKIAGRLGQLEHAPPDDGVVAAASSRHRSSRLAAASSSPVRVARLARPSQTRSSSEGVCSQRLVKRSHRQEARYPASTASAPESRGCVGVLPRLDQRRAHLVRCVLRFRRAWPGPAATAAQSAPWRDARALKQGLLGARATGSASMSNHAALSGRLHGPWARGRHALPGGQSASRRPCWSSQRPSR